MAGERFDTDFGMAMFTGPAETEAEQILQTRARLRAEGYPASAMEIEHVIKYGTTIRGGILQRKRD